MPLVLGLLDNRASIVISFQWHSWWSSNNWLQNTLSQAVPLWPWLMKGSSRPRNATVSCDVISSISYFKEPWFAGNIYLSLVLAPAFRHWWLLHRWLVASFQAVHMWPCLMKRSSWPRNVTVLCFHVISSIRYFKDPWLAGDICLSLVSVLVSSHWRLLQHPSTTRLFQGMCALGISYKDPHGRITRGYFNESCRNNIENYF